MLRNFEIFNEFNTFFMDSILQIMKQLDAWVYLVTKFADAKEIFHKINKINYDN